MDTDVFKPEPTIVNRYHDLCQIVISHPNPHLWAVIGMTEKETIYREQFTSLTGVFRAVEALAQGVWL